MLFAGVLYAAGMALDICFTGWVLYLTRTMMLVVYLGAVCYFENVPKITPLLHRLLRR